MTGQDLEKRLAQLAYVLDTCGAREERWPEALRAELSALIAGNEAAARLLAEARALDKILAFTPRPRRTEGLEARILASAATLPQAKGEAGSVVTFPRRASPDRTIPGRAVAVRSAAASGRRLWPELALLAASLFLGFAIGLSGEALPALQDIAVVADGEGALGELAGLLLDAGDAPDQGAL